MSLPVIVIGAGGHGKVVADALLAAGRTVLGFVDANPALAGATVAGLPVLGGDAEIGKHGRGTVELANGIGSTGLPSRRREIYDRFKSAGLAFATVVHPSAVVSRRAVLAEGAQVMAGAVVQTDARLEPNCIVNTGAQVDHDCLVGRHCHLAPGVTLSGEVCIGEESHLGTGATVKNGIRIGARVLVAAGAVVVADVADGRQVEGVPARERTA